MNKTNLHQAEYEYRIAVGLEPDFAEAHYNLANTLRALGHYDEAIEKLPLCNKQQAGLYRNVLQSCQLHYEIMDVLKIR